MNVSEHLQTGALEEAIAAQADAVRQQPNDPDGRALLCDLLCLSADYTRADQQLEAILTLNPDAIASVSLTRQLLRAETWRQEAFQQGRVPEFLAPPSGCLELHLRASVALRAGEQSQALAWLEQAAEERKSTSYQTPAGVIEEWLDCDDLLAGVLEILTSTGKYYWVPSHEVRMLELRPMDRPRDLLWRQAHVELDGGTEGDVYLPMIYAPLDAAAETDLRLGRKTQWSDGPVVRGSGLRMFLCGDEAVAGHDLPRLGRLKHPEQADS